LWVVLFSWRHPALYQNENDVNQMHELSIALSIVDGVLDECERRGGAEVETVHVRMGRLSGVDKDALLFSYGVACEGTPLERSRLLIEDCEATIFCSLCGVERAVKSFPLMMCAECGTPAARIVHGQELEITAMEMLT
jgi:hydrogenase nickel incorporation protein HypA/HybF